MGNRNIQPLDELEMFELLQVCYPEKFPDESDETFESAMEFANELCGFDDLADLLGRVALLTMPMASSLSGTLSHCLGAVTFRNGEGRMTAVVRREFHAVEEPHQKPQGSLS